MRAVAIAALAMACDARPPVTSCADGLAGEWDAGAGQHWVLVESPGRVEGYPMFVDHPAALTAGVTTAPRALDLPRTPSGLATGTIARRYELGARSCVATAEVHVLACAAGTLELTLAEPGEPVFVTDGDGCTAVRPGSSRRERWTRVR